MSNVLYKQEEKTFIFNNRGAVCSAGKGEDKIAFYLVNRPHWTNEQIAHQIFNGSATVPDGSDPQRTVMIKNPRLIQLENRIALERQNIVAKQTKTPPRAKPIRSRPVKKAGR